MEEKIKNIKKYNKRMSRAIKDKLFFLPILKNKDVDTIVDFGCADGTLLKSLDINWKKIGIDNNASMCSIANENFPEAIYVNSFNDIKLSKNNKTILNLSSVIHEVYSYCSVKEIESFWNHVFGDGYKYIVIRDMSVSEKANREVDFSDLYYLMLKLRMEKDYERKMDMFDEHLCQCSEWSKQDDHKYVKQKDLIHYYLKYRYEDNWDREVHENYLALSTEKLLKLIPKNYKIIYKKHFVLPFIKKDVLEKFDYNIEDNTHIKLILEKTED